MKLETEKIVQKAVMNLKLAVGLLGISTVVLIVLIFDLLFQKDYSAFVALITTILLVLIAYLFAIKIPKSITKNEDLDESFKKNYERVKFSRSPKLNSLWLVGEILLAVNAISIMSLFFMQSVLTWMLILWLILILSSVFILIRVYLQIHPVQKV